MKRRQLLTIGISFVTAGLAGCSGGDNSDADPEEVAPDTPEGWTKDTDGTLAPPDEAESGYYAYFIDPNGTEYRIEVIKFSSNSAADSYTYSDSSFGWTHEASVGKYFFACRLDTDTDENNCVELLTNTPKVSESDIEYNNS